jgi:hypothetical protein
MCYWVLPASGIPIARTTVQAVPSHEMGTRPFKIALQAYNESLE